MARLGLCGLLLVPALACLPDGTMKHDGPVVPEALADGWQIDTPENVGLDPDQLAAIHRDLLREDRHFGALAFLVVRDGKLVFETYLRDPADRDRHHHLQSVTKSFTSLAFGAARDEGLFPDLEARLASFFPAELEGLDPAKGEITLAELLTMRSGLAFDNDDFSMEMWVDQPPNPLRYILAKPLYAAPGERFYYRDADPQLVGYALQRAAGESEEAWMRRHVFDPLGITDYLWEHGPDVTMAAHGLHLRPRDMAKVGQLLLDEGRWQGRALVSGAWIAAATRAQATPQPSPWVPEGTMYGYYFWILPDGRGFTAAGHGGQFILVVPARRMVIVQVALPDTDDLQGGTLRDFLALVGPLLGP
jgi:CubicO group peptidase (beta-lactamase class C family)